jgi:hypothetical protein
MVSSVVSVFSIVSTAYAIGYSSDNFNIADKERATEQNR